jgi:hypothetical protein
VLSLNYKGLLEARRLIKIFSKTPDYPTYQKAIRLVKKYDDIDVWCCAIMLFVIDWNWVYFKDRNDIERFATELYQTLRNTKDTLKEISELNIILLDEESLERLETTIQTLYERFKGILGDTGASKALHVLCPNFFIMWDANIREGYDTYDYLTFLYGMRNELREAVELYGKDKHLESFHQAYKALEQQLGEILTRVIDEYNWLKHTRKVKICY